MYSPLSYTYTQKILAFSIVMLSGMVILTGCKDENLIDLANEAIPQIIDIEIPSQTFTNLPITLSATFKPGIWVTKERKRRFGYGSTPAATRGQNATNVLELSDSDCAPIPNTNDVRCTVNIRPNQNSGTFYFRWMFENTSEESDLIELPASAIEVRYALTAPTPPPPSGNNPNQPTNPATQPFTGYDLVLTTPEDGANCVGILSGGRVIVPLAWSEVGGSVSAQLDGDFQIIIEAAEGDECEEIDTAEPAEGDPTNCSVYHFNGNLSAAITGNQGLEYNWKVRSILTKSPTSFGTFSNQSSFTTLSQVTEEPEFIDPVGPANRINYPTEGEELQIAGTGRTINIRWTPVGCSPRDFTFNFFTLPLTPINALPRATGTGICYEDNNNETICEVEVTVRRGKSYRFDLTQFTAYGNISNQLLFSVRE